MRRSSKDFFESIGEYRHNIGIFLTYTLDTAVIDKLTEYSSGTILILHDFTQGKNLDDNCNSRIVCLPVKVPDSHEKNCFHSKLALLKSESGAKLILGSANLSTASFSSEKEIAFELELSFDNPHDVYLYKKILDYLETLNRFMLLLKTDILSHTLKRMYIDNILPEKSDIEFIENSRDKSIFEGIKTYLENKKGEKKPNSIKIATPFVSKNYSEIQSLLDISTNVSIYLRKGAKRDPFHQLNFKIYRPKGKKLERFHAKLILFEYRNESILYIGSANFTEQGFFRKADGPKDHRSSRNNDNAANLECGIILKVPKEEMNAWFSDSIWEKLSKEALTKYNDDGDNSTAWMEDNVKFYAWAERNKDEITTYFYNPDKKPIRKVNDGKKIKLYPIEKGYFFKTNDLADQDNTISFSWGDEKVTISIFDLQNYNDTVNEKGESIFDSFKGIDSINPKELDEAISQTKISVSETTSIKITEPPKLEQYYYNVKNLIQQLKHKKYLSRYNEEEIQREICQSNDGRTMYLILQMLKLFHDKSDCNYSNLCNLLRTRIEELSHELNIDKSKMDTFIKEWLISKN
jgi:phosphatidylserine/phosphatidylglycerophosphate/cardiolipin synthase-like enzyme